MTPAGEILHGRPEAPTPFNDAIQKIAGDAAPPEDEQMLAHMQQTVRAAAERIDHLETELHRHRRIHQAAIAAIEQLDVPRPTAGGSYVPEF